MKSKIISITLVIAGFIFGATALSALADWTAPNCTPPLCNTPTPINVATSSQSKIGPLQVNWNLINPSTIGLQLNGRIQINGAPGDTAVNTVGSVLTNMGNGVGTWQNLGAVAGIEGTDIIECVASGGSGAMPQGTITKTFVPSDCGGVLPDSSYHGALRSIEVLGTPFTFLNSVGILDSDEPSGPGYTYSYQRAGMSVPTPVVTAIYIKPGGSGSGSQTGLVVGGFENVNATVPVTAWGDCSSATNIIEVGVSSNTKLNYLCIHK